MEFRSPIGFLLMILIVVVIGIGVVIPYVADRAEQIDLTETGANDSYLDNIGNKTLNTAITSLTATRNNQTWLEFDGVNDVVNISDNSIFSPANSNLSFCVWINASAVSPLAKEYFVGKGSSGDFEFGLGYESTGQIRTTAWNLSGTTYGVTGAVDYFGDNFNISSFQDEWVHMCSVFANDTYLDIYIDGVHSGTDEVFVDAVGDGSEVLQLGSRTGDYFNGSLDSFVLYNSILTPSQVSNIYTSSEHTSKNLSIPIILLHDYNGTGVAPSSLIINQSVLKDILDYLNSSGYETITDFDLYNWTQGDINLPEKPVMITWDDSYVHNWLRAAKFMDDYGYFGVMALQTADTETSAAEWENVTRLINIYNWSIMSHSDSHCHMGRGMGGSSPTWCNDTVSRLGNLSIAKGKIINNTNVTPISHVYPYNDYGINSSDKTEVMVDCLKNYTICFADASTASDNNHEVKFVYIDANLSVGGVNRLTLDNETREADMQMIFNETYATVSLEVKLNENSGTTAYDSSDSGNNGTISGASWNTDSVDITLTENTDYRLFKTPGVFELVEQDLEFSEINMSYVYTRDVNSSASTITHLINLLIAISIITIIVLFIKSRLEF